MSTTSLPRFHAILNLTKNRVAPILSSATVITTAMAAETATFPSPVPSLATVLGQINTLHVAQQALASGARGAAAGVRDAALDALWDSLVSLKGYVQSVANASLENSFTIIKTSGFTVHTPPSRSKPILKVKLTTTSGLVKVMANAAALAGGSKQLVTYNWQYSVDGGHTWVSVPSTPIATIMVGGLPSMTHCSFRVSVTRRQEEQPWSQVVTVLVI